MHSSLEKLTEKFKSRKRSRFNDEWGTPERKSKDKRKYQNRNNRDKKREWE